MSEKSRLAMNSYMREWRAKNPDKVRAVKERYWEKKADKKDSIKEPMNAEPIAISVKDAAKLIGISKTKMYELIKRSDCDFSVMRRTAANIPHPP